MLLSAAVSAAALDLSAAALSLSAAAAALSLSAAARYLSAAAALSAAEIRPPATRAEIHCRNIYIIARDCGRTLCLRQKFVCPQRNRAQILPSTKVQILTPEAPRRNSSARNAIAR